MFRNTVTGEKIQDSDYKWHYTRKIAQAKRDERDAAEARQARIDREEVADRLDVIENEINGADRSAFAGYLDNMRSVTVEDLIGTVSADTLDDIVEDFNDVFMGTWGSEEEYTHNAIADGLFGEPTDGPLGNYIDVASLTRDLFLTDLYSIPAPGYAVHVYINC